MSKHEAGNTPAYSLEAEFYETFYESVLDDWYATFADDKKLVESSTYFNKIAEHDPIGITPLLDRAIEQIDTSDPLDQEDKATDYYFLACALAQAKHFDKALYVLSKLDNDARVREEQNLFSSYRDIIPEPYLERAAIVFANWGSAGNSMMWLGLLGDTHPSIRPTALTLMKKVVEDDLMSATPQDPDRCQQVLAETAGRFGDMTTARDSFNKISSPGARLGAEIAIAKASGIFLEHDNFDEIRKILLKGDRASARHRVWQIMQLDEIQDTLGDTRYADAVRSMAADVDDIQDRFYLLSEIATVYQNDPALEDAIALLAEVVVTERSTMLCNLCFRHGTIIATRCIPEVLSVLMDSDEDIIQKHNRSRLSEHLITGLAQAGETETALEYFELVTKNLGHFERERALYSLVTETARKGREYLDAAVAVIAHEEQSSDYNLGRLSTAIAIGGDAYLSVAEKEMYIGALGNEYMSAYGLIELALASKNIDYLVRAKSTIDMRYKDDLLRRIAEAYQEITKS